MVGWDEWTHLVRSGSREAYEAAADKTLKGALVHYRKLEAWLASRKGGEGASFFVLDDAPTAGGRPLTPPPKQSHKPPRLAACFQRRRSQPHSHSVLVHNLNSTVSSARSQPHAHSVLVHNLNSTVSSRSPPIADRRINDKTHARTSSEARVEHEYPSEYAHVTLLPDGAGFPRLGDDRPARGGGEGFGAGFVARRRGVPHVVQVLRGKIYVLHSSRVHSLSTQGL